jgi:hypothetical protein
MLVPVRAEVVLPDARKTDDILEAPALHLAVSGAALLALLACGFLYLKRRGKRSTRRGSP